MTGQTQRTHDAPVEAKEAGPAAVRTMALALWVVVGCLLAYGIAQTVVKASALFG